MSGTYIHVCKGFVHHTSTALSSITWCFRWRVNFSFYPAHKNQFQQDWPVLCQILFSAAADKSTGVLTPAQTPNNRSIILDNQLLCGAFTAITPWPCRLSLHHIHQVRPCPHSGSSLALCSCFNHPPSELVCCSLLPATCNFHKNNKNAATQPFLQFKVSLLL